MTATDITRMRILVVEDHPVLQEVIREHIERLPRVKACSVAPSAEAALAMFEQWAPDLMLIDLSLPGMNGIALIAELRRKYGYLHCAILSGHVSQAYVRQALAAGAQAYVLKGDPAEIERGIDAIVAGKLYLSEGLKLPA